MADSQEPKQTTPKGAEIPVPTRDAVLRDLMKAAPKAPPASADDPSSASAKPPEGPGRSTDSSP